MTRPNVTACTLLLGLVLILGGCGGGSGTINNITTPPSTTSQTAASVAPSAVYTTSNALSGNQILAFDRFPDGTLIPAGQFDTGGKGLSFLLDTQGSLIFNATLNRFFCVNAGDNSISMMSLNSDGTLSLLAHVASGGSTPVSIAQLGQTVYVVNAGDGNANPANISGFTINGNTLTPIGGSTQLLSATNPAPDQIGYTPNGAALIVTERGAAFITATNAITTNLIDFFPLVGGVAQARVPRASDGNNPFAFEFDNGGHFIVCEVEGAGPGAGTASSYNIGPGLTLNTISSKVGSGQTASCWLVMAGNFAYITNILSNTVSRYQADVNGTLTFLSASATGNRPIDEAITPAQDLLYLINNADHTLSFYNIEPITGALGAQRAFGPLPTHASGLVAR